MPRATDPIPGGGVPNNPIILFASGDDCVLLRETVIARQGREMSRLLMLLPGNVIRRYDIRAGMYDFDPQFQSIVREYPKTAIVKLSDNPEAPRYFAFVNFDGTEVDAKTKNMAFIKEMMDRLDTLSQENKRLKADVRRLNEELIKMIDRYSEWRQRGKPLFEDSGEQLGKMMFFKNQLDKKAEVK